MSASNIEHAGNLGTYSLNRADPIKIVDLLRDNDSLKQQLTSSQNSIKMLEQDIEKLKELYSSQTNQLLALQNQASQFHNKIDALHSKLYLPSNNALMEGIDLDRFQVQPGQ